MERPKSKRYHCEHCDEYISKTLYYRHRSLYYDKHARKWSKERVHEVLDGSDCFDVDIDIDDSDDDVDVESNHGEQQ